MGNETFLVVSYFAGGVACLCVGLAAWLWLCRPVHELTGALPRKPWSSIILKSLPATFILLALAAFLSVSYPGCDNRTYDSIVADRSYMIARNLEQISSALSWAAAGVLVWGVIILFGLLAIRREHKQTKSSGNHLTPEKGQPT